MEPEEGLSGVGLASLCVRNLGSGAKEGLAAVYIATGSASEGRSLGISSQLQPPLCPRAGRRASFPGTSAAVGNP